MRASSILEKRIMTTSATKIELVTEAVEALVLATVIAASPTIPKQDTRTHLANHQNVVDAREVLRKALAEAFAPTLRVLSGSPGGPARSDERLANLA